GRRRSRRHARRAGVRYRVRESSARRRRCARSGKESMTFPRASSVAKGSAVNDAVPFTDLSFQWRQIEAKVLPDISRLFEESAFCLGPFVERFERAVAEYLGVTHAIGVNSGTSALHLALIAAGIGPGDKVLVPSYTFVATAWPVLYVGATPV